MNEVTLHKRTTNEQIAQTFGRQ